jgi:sporulation protein YqfC
MAKEKQRLPQQLPGSVPLIETVGNRRVTIEGSTGVLLYESEAVKVAAGRMLISLEGRGLRLRCISGSCVEINGFISKIEFLC